MYYSLNYYNGAVKRKYVEHTSSFLQNGGINEEFEYTYDHAGRLLETYHSLNGDNRVLLSSNTYDELGRISVEKVADIPNLLTSFKYNVRGWLTEASNDVCKQSLYYNEKRNEIKSISQWNGNLSSYSCGDKSYDYSYDLSNRLSSSYSTELYNGSLVEGLHSTSYTYDSMGNMLSIQRRSVNLDTCNEGDRDDVTFEYDGNQLVRLTNLGFKDSSYDMQISDEANLDGTEYAYDSNGNMIKDANKGIYLIKYNMLNLPEDIYANNGNWHYSYDADGNKLAVYSITLKTPLVIPSSQLMEKKFTDGELEPLSQTMQRSYNGEYVYEYSSQIKKLELVRLGLPNGYISFPASNHVYHFYVKDHLGNNRYVINADTKKVEQTSDYYPFGSLYNENSNENAQRWRFGGKEVNRSFDIYDFLARWYDPTLGRFTTIDPMAEKYVGISPYLYCANNPTNAFDPTGTSIYFLFYAKGNDRIGKGGDDDFYNAAMTRKMDIEQRENFDSQKDIVLLLPFSDMTKLQDEIEENISRYSEKYGKTKEVSFWSHAGFEGPIGTVNSEGEDITGTRQLSINGWRKIDFNWGKQASLGFFGCNTGNVNDKYPEAFAKQISEEIKNVNVYGQPTVSSFSGSQYKASYVGNNKIKYKGKEFKRTYQVSTKARKKFWIFNDTVLRMKYFRNGKQIR